MQLALYREERPETFEEIIGQKHIVRILQNQVRTGTVSQAYLFAGTHGTGKTSIARILAKAVNCLEVDNQTEEAGEHKIPCGHCENCETIREGRFVDVVELDAASNNRVEDLRAIIDMVKYPPTVGRYKVYIIDEVHMLSSSAENAFLKTLEEPPAHAIFILATTDPQKVRSTIRSRCMQLNFRRVSEQDLIAGMENICKRKNLNATEDALMTIAMKSDGSVRDALSILEQCVAAGDSVLDRNLVLEYTGSAGEDFYIALTDAVRKGELGKALLYIDEIMLRGKEASNLLKDWLEHYRNLMVVKYVSKPERIIGASPENISRLKKQADELKIKDIEKAIRFISEQISAARYSDRPRILFETTAVRLAQSDEILIAKDVSADSNRTKNIQATKTKTHSKSNTERDLKPEQSESIDKEEPINPVNKGIEKSTIIDTDTDYLIRESTETAEKIWSQIASKVAEEDRSFISLIAKFSRGTDYVDGELRVTVKPNKYALADRKINEITKAAKSLYGQNIYVTLQSGELPNERKGGNSIPNKETDRVIDEDIAIKEITDEVKNLFDLDVNITDN